MSHERFERAIKVYTEQVLDAIEVLVPNHPFSAVTLACCAIDLLANTLYGSEKDDFIRTVDHRLEGYSNDDIPENIYELRCGLVHEFRTHTADGTVPIALTGKTGRPPEWNNDVLIISVEHFCGAVQTAFKSFFESATANQQGQFIDRASVYVVEFLLNIDSSADDGSQIVSTMNIPASGSGGPFPQPNEYDDFTGDV